MTVAVEEGLNGGCFEGRRGVLGCLAWKLHAHPWERLALLRCLRSPWHLGGLELGGKTKKRKGGPVSGPTPVPFIY